MSSNEQKFKYDSNYQKESSFTRIKFGHDMPILETELNEAQILQEKARTSLTRRMVPSGFVEMVEKEFGGPAILYNPLENGVNKFNHIALAPCRTIINGYELTLEGNFTYDNYDNYILIDLEDAPNEGNREDLIYLEVWFQVLSGNDNVHEYGFRRGNPTGYTMMDPRVNEETSRRIAMCWDIKIAKGINFDQYPEGLGYINAMNYSNIVGEANGSIPSSSELIYMNASDDTFKDCEFYKDSNLYVAGRPNTPITSSSIYSNYIFAIPLFKVKRRNKQGYSIANFNGSISYNSVYSNQSNNSNINGDLINDIRPDKLYYDMIYECDISDLRKTISFKEFNQHYYLDKSIKDLFTGNLQTKEINKMRRVQFGVPNISNINEEMVKFNSTFDNTLKPSIKGVVNPTYTYTNPIYKDSLNSYGLFLNGENWVKYNLPVISGEGVTLNVNRGTIDFYFQPYWSGADDISQKIFSIKDIVGNTVFEFYKEGSYLKWKQFFDETTSNDIQVDLSNTLLMAKNIYHIRLSWCSDGEAFSNIYINGKKAAPSLYQINSLENRNYILQIGDIEDQSTFNGTGFVIENLIIYNAIFENEPNDVKWPGLPLDVIYGDSLLLPSFNSKLSNFSDNSCTQTTTELLLATNNYNGFSVFNFEIPAGEIIEESSLIVKNAITNEIIDGTWENIDVNIRQFTTVENINQILLTYKKIVDYSSSNILDENNEYSQWETIFRFNIPTGEVIDNNSLKVYDIANNSLLTGEWSNIDESTKQFTIAENIPQILLQYKNIVNINSSAVIDADSIPVNSTTKFTFELPNGKNIDENTLVVKDITTNELITGNWINIDVDTKQFITTSNITQINVEFLIISEDKTLIISPYGESTNAKTFIFELPNNKVIDKENIIVQDVTTNNIIVGTWSDIDLSSMKFITTENINQILIEYSVIKEIVSIILNKNDDQSNKFTFNIPKGKTIDNNSLKVYNVDNGNIINGIWEDIDENTKQITTIDNFGSILLQYDLIIPPGNGGYDLPGEILGAGIVNGNDIISEVSYCRQNSEQPRQISYLKPRLINGIYDTAYDYPSDRNTNQCFARLLEYHISGNGTNEYNIPSTLYGYEVIGILEVVNQKLVQCTKLDDGVLSFSFKLKDRVLNGDIITLKLALGGIGFDYETQTKTLVNNIYRTKILEFTANGNDSEYVISTSDDTESLGGIIKSILTFTDNDVNSGGGLNGQQTEYNTCFINNEMFSPVYQVDPLNPANNQLIGYELVTYTLQTTEDSFGTPFLRIIFDNIPAAGDIIKIPVLVTYQPPKDVNLSIWYNYIPYQGMLSNRPRKLKKVSDWKYFTTTLSSGNINVNIEEENIFSLNNIINRLPGGMAYAYTVDGKSIAFEYVSNMFTNTNNKINNQLAFVNDVFFANNSLDNAIFPLDTEFTVYKSAKGFQDGKLVIQNKDFSVFLPNGAEAVTKYLGMSCLVIDENGELLLFVIGNLVPNATTTNELVPIYGDLFRIKGIPTTIKF